MKTLSKVLTLLFALQAYAVPVGPCGNESCCGQKRAQCCEPAPGPMAFSFCKDIGLACPADFYVYGEFLYMQASEDGLEYGISFTPCEYPADTTPIQFPVTNGNVEDFSKDNRGWHWNEGWRVGLGFQAGDCWLLEGVFTHVNVTDHTTTSLNNSQILVPLWMGQATYDPNSDALGSARWKADFNTFDFQFSAPYHTSRYFTFNPHVGVRFAYIDQYYQAEYSGVWDGVDGADFTANNDFWGIGTRIGVDTEWQAGCGAGVYGNASASLLYGKFDISQTWLAGPAANDSQTNNDLEFEFYTTAANLDMQIGAFWSLFFCDMRYRVLMKLGYEFQMWWDQNRMRTWSDVTSPIYNDEVSRGDFGLNGLVFRLQFDF
jgi:hypothetical protein